MDRNLLIRVSEVSVVDPYEIIVQFYVLSCRILINLSSKSDTCVLTVFESVLRNLFII